MASLDTALLQAAADTAMITYDEVAKALIIPEALKTVGVKGDRNSRLITFSLPEKPDLVDLAASDTSLIMDFKNAAGQTGQFPIADKQATDGRVIFSVAMPASMCVEKGTVSVGIRAYDADERCWLTGYGTMELQDALDVTDITAEDPRYTLLEEVMARLGMSEDDMSGFLKKSEADATYYKKTEPIVLTDEQKAELKGDQGAKGEKGDPGEPGADGEDGAGRFPDQAMTMPSEITIQQGIEYHFGEVTGEHAISFSGEDQAQYHFFLSTGETAPTISFPADTKFRNANFQVEASKIYEFDAWELDGNILILTGEYS